VYLERHGPRKRTAHNDRNMLHRYFNGWQHRRLSSLKRQDIVLLHLYADLDGVLTRFAEDRTLLDVEFPLTMTATISPCMVVIA
jgi:hypothetical protein